MPLTVEKIWKNGQRYWNKSKNPYVENFAASKVSIPIQILDEFRMLYSVCVELNNHFGVNKNTLSIQVRNNFHPRGPNPKIPEQRYTKPKKPPTQPLGHDIL